MTDVLTPPSPQGPYSSGSASEQYSESYHPSLSHGGHYSTHSRDSARIASSWESSRRAEKPYSVPSTYYTPPPSHSDVASSSMLQQSRAPSFAAAPSHMPPRVASSQPSQPPQSIPQLPLPQPQVTYQPVPSAQAEPVLPPPAQREDRNGSSENTQIASYMQIPSSINSSKGSLSEFAAQITCLFWFESIFNLQRVEDSASTPAPLAPLADDAKPTIGFRKWVTTMLSTTQVTQNVILLALMFIYRLKRQNPQVRGKAGSEYRLLTVALMLGNKFLDDNTYTNKTWADVSGISVAEIHVMEVEFLSNMRYTLYTSEDDWHLWHKKLGRFYDYFEKASRSPQPQTRPSPSITSTFSSPGATHVGQIVGYSPASQHPSPPYSHSNTPLRPQQLPPPLPEAASYMPPAQQQPEGRPVSRKRAYDEEVTEPYSKRSKGEPGMNSGILQTTPGLSSSASTPAYSELPTPKLPMPNFNHYTSSQAFPNPLQTATHLPLPQARSMAMVYGQPAQPQHQTQLNIPHTMGQNGSRISIPSIFDHSQSGTPSQLHPKSTGSPSNLALTPTNHEHLSPSVFPMNRSSPYRPVRSVNTLLVPPPTSSVQSAPQNLGSNSMHYQPIGKPPTERRSGVVPYMHHDRSPWVHPYPQYSHAHP